MAEITKREGNYITIEHTFDLRGDMLETEENIMMANNEIGLLATKEKLEKYDADGSAIKLGSVTMSSKGKIKKDYETPFGTVSVERYIYQGNKGGETYCPLDENARIITSSTPRLAKLVSSKYAKLSVRDVIFDIEESHGRKFTKGYIQKTAETISAIAQIKEEKWEYDIPKVKEEVKVITFSIDGAMVRMGKEGYREVMSGSIALYGEDGKGERKRFHTIYIAASPEYGKAKFFKKMQREMEITKRLYPSSKYVAVADGAKDNWKFLEPHVDYKILDFYHATEYLSYVSYAYHPKDDKLRKEWQTTMCHKLKHDLNAAKDILSEMEKLKKDNKLTKLILENLQKAITYFTNNLTRMNYWEHIKSNLPIGSGVTEAACKVVVKQRLCNSGMQWKEFGIKTVLSLRTLILTKDRWQQYWAKINQYGVIKPASSH